jgi:TPR repeat protein
VFIDACRNDPLTRSFYAQATGATRSATPEGLAPVVLPLESDPEGGTMLAFSASPGQFAYDGAAEDGHSPFAESLANHLQTPGIEILSAMKRVIGDVRQVTADRQVPIVSNDLAKEIYLAAAEPPEVTEIAQPEASVANPPVSNGLGPDPELAAFNAAVDLGTMEGWDFFLRLYPEGRYSGVASEELARLQNEGMPERTSAPPVATGGPSDAAMQFALARVYEAGDSVPQDLSEAARLYRLSAEQGYSQAQSALGDLLYAGRGVPRDYAAALSWYRLAAAQGDARAHAGLGLMHANGLGVMQDDAEAARLLGLAAEQGHAGAQAFLGSMYADGVGVPRDDTQAARLLGLAAGQGLAWAQVQLGFMHRYGLGVEENDVEAARLFRLAAEQGHSSAQVELAMMYAEGAGLPQDNDQAARLFGLAAGQGDPRAEFALAMMHAEALGMPQDDAEALRLLRKAAEQGLAAARYNLGLMYAYGRGVPADRRQGAEMILAAFAQGDPWVQDRLAGERAVQVTPELRRELQIVLQEEGMYRGGIDGVFGSGTLGALDLYAREFGSSRLP